MPASFNVFKIRSAAAREPGVPVIRPPMVSVRVSRKASAPPRVMEYPTMRAMSSSAWVGDCDRDQADCTSATATSTPRANQLGRSIQTFFLDCNPSGCGSEFVEILDVRTGGTVQALHLWI